MQDLDRPLQVVNRSLWEEICSFSEEEVLEGSMNDGRSLLRRDVCASHPACPPHPHPPRFDSQLQSFGAKLKEQNNLFRKRSKAQSHDMKEVLYSNVVQANEVGDSAPQGHFIDMATTRFGNLMNFFFLSSQEVQQSLREKIDEADEMVKTLDDCIDELKTGTVLSDARFAVVLYDIY